MTKRLLPLLLAAAASLAMPGAHAASVEVPDFDVYVDPPTAFVFVKLPQGWKFVGKLDEVRLGALPPNVHAVLLEADDREPATVAATSAAAKQ